MPPPANFSNFGRSSGTAALDSRRDNFASFAPPITPPPLKVTPPVLRPPTPNSDFSGQDKNIPPQNNQDCPVELVYDSASGEYYCPVDQGSPDEQGYDRDQYDNPYDYGDGSASPQDVQNAAQEGQQLKDEISDIGSEIAKYLKMASGGTDLLRLVNAALNGTGLESQANSVMTDANRLNRDAVQLQANVNAGINTLNAGIANQNRGQIQSAFDQLQAAKIQGQQIQDRGQDVTNRLQTLQSNVNRFQQTDTRLQIVGQGLAFGAQGITLANQGYTAFNNPTPANIGTAASSGAQATLGVLSQVTDFVSPIGAQIINAGIQGTTAAGVKYGEGGSPTDVGVAFTNFFSPKVGYYSQKASSYAAQGDDLNAAKYGTYAGLEVIGTAASFFPPIGTAVAKIGVPALKGITAGVVASEQGFTIGESSAIGADVFITESMAGTALRLYGTATQTKYGDVGYLSAESPISAALQTLQTPLVTTQRTTTAPSYSSRTTGYQGYTYNAAARAEIEAAKATAQLQAGRVYPAGNIPPEAYQSAGFLAKPILDKYGIPLPAKYQFSGGIAPANFATE
jgi:hypothetical protein